MRVQEYSIKLDATTITRFKLLKASNAEKGSILHLQIPLKHIQVCLKKNTQYSASKIMSFTGMFLKLRTISSVYIISIKVKERKPHIYSMLQRRHGLILILSLWQYNMHAIFLLHSTINFYEAGFIKNLSHNRYDVQ